MSGMQNQYNVGLDKTPANYVALTPLSFLKRSAAVFSGGVFRYPSFRCPGKAVNRGSNRSWGARHSGSNSLSLLFNGWRR